MMRRCGVTPERTGDDRARQDDHRALSYPDQLVRRPRRADDTEEQRGFTREGGWSAVYPGAEFDGGLVAHRGVLHADEYVDMDVLADAVAERLGFTVQEIRSVYRQGPLSDSARALRDRVDARILAVSDSGGLLVELGRALGWAVKPDGHCRTVENALARAREAQA